MCENRFKNIEEKKRKEVFTKLFATLASNAISKGQPIKKVAQK